MVVVYYTNLQRQNRVPNLFLSSNNIPHPSVISVLKLALILAVESIFEIMPFLVKVLVAGGWGRLGWVTYSYECIISLPSTLKGVSF